MTVEIHAAMIKKLCEVWKGNEEIKFKNNTVVIIYY